MKRVINDSKQLKIVSILLFASLLLILPLSGCEYFQTLKKTVSVKVALIHFNPVLGDDEENLQRLESLVSEAFSNQANIVVTPELATTGFCITREQVIADLGYVEPFPQLDALKNLAVANNGYVFIGIAEKTADNEKVYNTVAIMGPDGYTGKQRKRAMSGWHDRGDLPFDILQTPYGDIGTIVCSDSYLPDMTRILALNGADLFILPANWWGTGQDIIWQTRARENGIWAFVNNRWGLEVDERYGYPYTYDMSDAPSAVISPAGNFELRYRSMDDPAPADKILYYTAEIPANRIGNNLTPVYSLNKRSPASYTAIGNEYYRPDLGNQLPPDLPPTGTNQYAALSYLPSVNAAANLTSIRQIWETENSTADIVVLPALGITKQAIHLPDNTWYNQAPWTDVQQFVDENAIELLFTTANETNTVTHTKNTALLVFQQNTPPRMAGQIHDTLNTTGTGGAPFYIDLADTRIGMMTGADSLFPELTTALTKSGIDVLLVSSDIGTTKEKLNALPINYYWNSEVLISLWKTRTNHVIHLVASDSAGIGAVIKSEWGMVSAVELSGTENPLATLELDSASVRTKYLNAYYTFDLSVLTE